MQAPAGALISVPCERCSAPVHFGEQRCAECKTPVSRSAQEAIERRLEATSSEYREHLDEIASARAVLLIVTIGYASLGLIGGVLSLRDSTATAEDQSLARWLLSERLGLALVFGLLWRFARAQPALAMVAAIALWVVHGVLSLMVALFGFIQLFIDAVVTIMLLRGMVAASRAERLRRRLLAR